MRRILLRHSPSALPIDSAAELLSIVLRRITAEILWCIFWCRVQPGELGRRHRSQLAALPVRQRTAVAARYLLDWSEAQTAQVVGCRVGTVKALSSRGPRRLREGYLVREGSDHD